MGYNLDGFRTSIITVVYGIIGMRCSYKTHENILLLSQNLQHGLVRSE
jgi:hypothetical protein